jgi:hypothetical protein
MKKVASSGHAGFLLELLFEDGDEMFLRNFCRLSTDRGIVAQKTELFDKSMYIVGEGLIRH